MINARWASGGKGDIGADLPQLQIPHFARNTFPDGTRSNGRNCPVWTLHAVVGNHIAVSERIGLAAVEQDECVQVLSLTEMGGCWQNGRALRGNPVLAQSRIVRGQYKLRTKKTRAAHRFVVRNRVARGRGPSGVECTGKQDHCSGAERKSDMGVHGMQCSKFLIWLQRLNRRRKRGCQRS